MATDKAKKKQSKKNAKLGWRGQLLMIAMIIAAVVFLPSTVLLAVGLLPTVVAGIIDRSKEKTRSITVGCMNFTGCCPYWLDLLTVYGHSINGAAQIITEPLNIVIMYSAALLGYLIDWAMSGMVSTVMIQRAEQRLKKIDREQKELIRRWGRGVTGDYRLDRYGFPVDEQEEVEGRQSADQDKAG
jgi:hypothetical protein